MERLTENTGSLDWSRRYARLGWPLLPIAPGTKAPAVRGWQRFESTDAELLRWMGDRGCGVAIRTGESGYVVVDTDTPAAEAWAAAHLPATPMRSASGGGSVHRWYAAPPKKRVGNKQAWHGIKGLDVRGWGGYLILPGNVHPATGRPYEWLTGIATPSDLPAFSPRWVYERRRAVRAAVADTLDPVSLLARGRRYVEKIAPAVDGANGHTATFVAALKIVRFAGRDRDIAWALLQHYNATRCVGPWGERALQHKLDEAFRHAR